MSQVSLPMPKVEDDVTPLKGGMDQMTPSLTLAPGVCRRSMNYEAAINGGYTRIGGYERFNGESSPSSMTFTLIPIPTFSSTPTVGQTITGATSGAAAIIIAIGANYLVVTKILVAAFQENEFVTVNGVIIGAIGAQTVTLTKTLKKQYTNLAADYYRAFIEAVPGIGPVRGVFGYTNKFGEFAVYAFRDHDVAGSIQSDLWKSTFTGWEAVNIRKAELEFSAAGPVPIQEGSVYDYFGTDVTIHRVVHQGGSWAAQTAFGLLIVSTGGSFFHPINGPQYTINGSTFTSTHGAVAQRFHPGGSYETILANFGGRLNATRIYGCDGVNRCFEFDGETIVPIATGVEGYAVTSNGVFTSDDHPTHIVAHQNHLFVALGSSYLHSGPGVPYNFTAGAGAGEASTGDTITGFIVLPGVQASGALAVSGRNHTKILYGTALAGPEPFDLVSFETETGAIEKTIQKLDRVYYLDDRGVIDLKAAQEYGNFTTATVTRFIQTYIDQKHGRVACSVINRAKGQYRLLFVDGTGLYITLDNGKLRGAMPVAFPVPMFCAWSGEDNTGQEVGFVGGTDGYVYQLDRGTSFDGADIDAELLLNWNTMRSPRVRKALRKASIEISGTDYTEVRVGTRLGPEMAAHIQDADRTLLTENELTMHWDHFTWDDFWWDAHAEAPLEVDVKGTAERVQYLIGSGTDYLDSYTVSSIITSHIPRRRLR